MVELRSLEKYDGLTASSILAALVMEEGSPGVGVAATEATKYASERREVLDELRAHLHLDALDSSEAKSVLLTEITRQIYNLSMAGKDAEKVLARAGESGRLTPSLYRVAFHAGFQQFVDLGTKKNHITDAVMRPDDIQHLPGDGGIPAFSIILKLHTNHLPLRSFWLIVYMHRDGRNLITQNAWRLYTDEFDPPSGSRPIDFLRAFAERYGMVVEAGSQAGRFIFNANVDHALGKVSTAYLVKGTRNKLVHSTMSGFDKPDYHHVVIAFAVDLDKYTAMLRKRGVQVRLDRLHRFDRDEIKILVTNRGDVTDYEIR